MIPQVRAMHSAAFRRGQWATIVGVALLEGKPDSPRPCYVVMFPDGTTDLFMIKDEVARYEYQNLMVNS